MSSNRRILRWFGTFEVVWHSWSGLARLQQFGVAAEIRRSSSSLEHGDIVLIHSVGGIVAAVWHSLRS
jgi:hypothetical protein